MRLVTVMMAAALAIGSPGALAAVYKCVGADGKVAFQQEPCRQDTQAAEFSVDGTDWVTVSHEENDYSTRDTQIDVAHLKKVGRYLRAPMRDKVTTKGSSNYRYRTSSEPTIGSKTFVFYDCSENLVANSGVDERRVADYEQSLLDDRYDNGRWLQKKPNDAGLQAACAKMAAAAPQ